MQKIQMRRIFALILTICFSAICASAATFTVNSTFDGGDAKAGDGICDIGKGDCTFRAAIEEANAFPGADTINFDAMVFSIPQTISTVSSYPAITQNLTIIGISPENVKIDGTGNARLISVDPKVTVSISNLTLTNGYIGEASGGCIANAGNLTINNLVISFCQALLGSGGGIFTSGGSLTVNNSRFDSNIAAPFGNGGGIYSSNSTVNITGTTFDSNTAFFSGGGIYSSNSTVNITETTISNNTAVADFGSNKSTAQIGFGGSSGGGIYNENGLMTITRSTVGGDTAGENGNSADDGGGIFNLNGTINLINSTVSGNTAANIGGGYYGLGTIGTTVLNIDASTIAFNSAINGGGVAAAFITTKLTSLGGTNSVINLGNTIISNNTATMGADVSDDPNPDAFPGTIFSNGFNIISNPAGATITPNTGDKFGVNPLIAPLANNGGATLTHALLPGSPAIDAGNTTLTTDQRGQMRPVDLPTYPNAPGGNASDIGSFEAMVISAASVSVSGRIVNENGIGLARVHLTLTEADGTVHSALTNQLGFYNFENIQPGQIIVLAASRKGYQSQNQLLTVNEDVRDVDIVMSPF